MSLLIFAKSFFFQNVGCGIALNHVMPLSYKVGFFFSPLNVL